MKKLFNLIVVLSLFYFGNYKIFIYELGFFFSRITFDWITPLKTEDPPENVVVGDDPPT